MASIFPVSVRPDLALPSLLDELRRLESLDSITEHRIASNAESADMLLFLDLHYLEWRLEPLIDHPLRQRYPDKSLVYCDVDRPWCVLPGVYVSMPARTFDWRWQRPWLYFRTPADVEQTPAEEADLLFSFRGGRTHRCRDEVLRLRHDRAVVESSTRFLFHDRTSPEYSQQQCRFLALLRRSKFVLCPRGHGTSSIRLLETLASGRVPVIISDDWVPPIHLDWSTFSIRVPEASIEQVPALLEEREPEYGAMARRAADSYRRFFAPPVAFDNLVSLCGEILKDARMMRFPAKGIRGRGWARLWLADQHARRRERSSAADACNKRPSKFDVSNGSGRGD
jgi:hypothetical protein